MTALPQNGPPQTDSLHRPSGFLRNATLADGRRVDVRIDGSTIATVDPASGLVGPHDIDLRGYMLLNAPAEPHAHIDKALTANEIANPTGDLAGAINAWVAHVPHITVAETVDRGERAVRELVASGVTALRTHVNVHEGIELKAVEALLELRERTGHLLDLEIVALAGWVTGEHGEANLALLRSALAADPLIVVGGCPHLDVDPDLATDLALGLAAEYGRKIDLHTDETLDRDHLDLRYLARRVRETGFTGGVAASHCVSLGMQTVEVQRSVAAEVAEAGVAVITLPQTNLFLQARGVAVGPPRGLTAIRPLLAAGATVGSGADNVRDPFNIMGRSDPLETAALLVMAGHLSAEEAWECVSNGARRAMGLAAIHVAPGNDAELLAVPGASLADAIARADQARIVWHRGAVVARTSLVRTFAR